MNEYNKATTKVAHHEVHMLQMHGVMEYTCYKSMEWWSTHVTKVWSDGVHMLQKHGVMEYTCYKCMDYVNITIVIDHINITFMNNPSY
jgi:L-rhamnose mutarotase